jgi:poly-gamma-glutamate synthesis protein (capsule biosynthesis protein)
VIVSLHWGTERVAEPNAFQRRVADEVTRSGEVDLIVGHHAHVIQPIEQVNGRWVVFGMGNFLSNMPTGDSWPASTQDGMIVTVAIAEQPGGGFVVEQPVVTPTWVDRSNGFVIRPVLTDVLDPSLSAGVIGQLEASIARTRAEVGAFVAMGG